MTESFEINNQKSIISPLVVIVGETASGKTAAGIKIAQKVNGEIICADSRTVYKQMNIGTAKPTVEEQKLVRHHLIDVVNPNETFNVAEFQRLAMKCIQEIHKRGKIPTMVGGTGLYVDSVLYNFQFGNAVDDAYRQQLQQMDDVQLTTLLHTKNIDTSGLNTKNRRHVIRAIERGEAPSKDSQMRKNTFICGLRLDKDVLKERITNRVHKMFADGFLEEMAVLAEDYGWDNESMSGSGYRVVRDYFEGLATEEQVAQAFIQRDFSLAKRQRTWFRRNKNIQWYEDESLLITDAVAFTKDLPADA